ncbi:prepilin peptidase [Sulfoacidibacillus ferrooxidans]|uniref:prepilin peptidase n=1 Tax=Sulfoacidibacillus ferrooxidans TaxID=2005001 RepID=UPI001F5072C9|nr:A24 family peptidase [Sulfoacidibacillus ferrooxidans]
MGLYGLIFGSFFGVVGTRVPRGESIVTPPSHCLTCGHKLTPFELIPVLSWFLQKGRCRRCGTHVSIFYPIVEVMTGILFCITWMQMGLVPEFFISIFASSVFIVLSIIDYESYRLPNIIVMPSTLALLLARFFIHPLGFFSYISGALIGFLLIYAIIIFSKGGMGFGDAKLFLFVGFYVGFSQTIFTLVLASLLGALMGVLFMIMGRLQKRAVIPFGPFIGLSAIVVHLYGTPFITWYMKLIILH